MLLHPTERGCSLRKGFCCWRGLNLEKNLSSRDFKIKYHWITRCNYCDILTDPSSLSRQLTTHVRFSWGGLKTKIRVPVLHYLFLAVYLLSFNKFSAFLLHVLAHFHKHNLYIRLRHTFYQFETVCRSVYVNTEMWMPVLQFIRWVTAQDVSCCQEFCLLWSRMAWIRVGRMSAARSNVAVFPSVTYCLPATDTFLGYIRVLDCGCINSKGMRL